MAINTLIYADFVLHIFKHYSLASSFVAAVSLFAASAFSLVIKNLLKPIFDHLLSMDFFICILFNTNAAFCVFLWYFLSFTVCVYVFFCLFVFRFNALKSWYCEVCIKMFYWDSLNAWCVTVGFNLKFFFVLCVRLNKKNNIILMSVLPFWLHSVRSVGDIADKTFPFSKSVLQLTKDVVHDKRGVSPLCGSWSLTPNLTRRSLFKHW